jgi:hypothetical protein
MHDMLDMLDMLEIDENFNEIFKTQNHCCSLCNEGKVAKASIEENTKHKIYYCYFYCNVHENIHPEFLIIKVFPIEDKDAIFDFVKKILVLR